MYIFIYKTYSYIKNPLSLLVLVSILMFSSLVYFAEKSFQVGMGGFQVEMASFHEGTPGFQVEKASFQVEMAGFQVEIADVQVEMAGLHV